ncbi:GGDEF domain-containing protein [Chenggangzhangella methanolivorans]|uniref:diguanylate cyclase n=1 Tax=Chenggangzhangella methanolivorans TaxID=1437009 RepID=A0A9E6R7E6_9HYPH|nr:GGDEF domain-containing protein [Chenggangzhangella methanolivorans]QZN99368.1 GGDEF domain-containing protein [Chenggangzhangella methanolivorans]
MDRLLPYLRVKSGRHVLLWTGLITLIAVGAPVLSLAVPMAMMPRLPSSAFWGTLAIAAAIPLLIAPPISLFALSMLRLLTMTIERVDDYVRYDPLTGVLSRAYLLGQIRERLAVGGVFLMADADRFKSINHTYGHDIGDEALKAVASALRTALGPDALIGRLGGEEFGVFLVGADEARGASAAAAVCAAMREAGAVVADHELRLTISVGCATHRFGRSLEETMKLADQALYEAKHGGRDRYCVAGAPDATPTIVVRTAGRKFRDQPPT